MSCVLALISAPAYIRTFISPKLETSAINLLLLDSKGLRPISNVHFVHDCRHTYAYICIILYNIFNLRAFCLDFRGRINLFDRKSIKKPFYPIFIVFEQNETTTGLNAYEISKAVLFNFQKFLNRSKRYSVDFQRCKFLSQTKRFSC